MDLDFASDIIAPDHSPIKQQYVRNMGLTYNSLNPDKKEEFNEVRRKLSAAINGFYERKDSKAPIEQLGVYLKRAQEEREKLKHLIKTIII